jgi:hypothetical protein
MNTIPLASAVIVTVMTRVPVSLATVPPVTTHSAKITNANITSLAPKNYTSPLFQNNTTHTHSEISHNKTKNTKRKRERKLTKKAFFPFFFFFTSN